MDPLVIYDKNLFSITSADDSSKGARVSLATYGRDDLKFQLPSAERAPHFLLDGQVTVLGIGERTTITISKSGFAFRVVASVARVGKLDVTGNFTNPEHLSISGTLDISLGRIDCGWLGSVNVGDVSAGLEIKYENEKATARVKETSFSALGVGLSIPGFDITIGSDLAKLPEQAANQARDEILKHFVNPFEKAIKAIGDAAREAGDFLTKVFGPGTRSVQLRPIPEHVRLLKEIGEPPKMVFIMLTRNGKTPVEAVKMLLNAR
jgi:hypothetical protein